MGDVALEFQRSIDELPVMKLVHLLVALGMLCLAGANRCLAAGPPEAGPPDPLLDDHSLEALSQLLKGFFIDALPNPLVEEEKDWGRTIRVANGMKWKGKGLHGRPEITYADKNHGTWQKLRVSAVNLPQTLVFDIRDVRKVDPARVQFGVYLSFPAHVDATRQKWAAGVKLYDGNLRARLRIRLVLQCEMTSQFRPTEGLLPDLILQLRVKKADLQYDQFVTEHLAGLGGEAARLLGEAVRKSLRPLLERKLLNQADAAIVQAGQTKEVRLSLASLSK